MGLRVELHLVLKGDNAKKAEWWEKSTTADFIPRKREAYYAGPEDSRVICEVEQVTWHELDAVSLILRASKHSATRSQRASAHRALESTGWRRVK